MVLCWVFVILGTVVRVRQYAARRSLWLDEASIADNILNRSAAGLLRPLAHHQGAPLGWLFSEKIGVHLLGRNEYGLRLPSIAAGILTLFAVWWLAHLVLRRSLVPVAVFAAAVSPQLIRYSSETKQYGSDALAVTFIVALAITISRLRHRRLRHRRQGWRPAVTWMVAGVLVVMCSHPGIVATFSCCAVLLVRLWSWGSRAVFWRFAAASAVITAAFVAHYELVLKDLSKDTSLAVYWKSGSPPKPFAFGSFVRWVGRAIVDYAHDPLHLGPTLLVGMLFAAGLVALARRNATTCVLLVLPLALQFAVSAAGKFPLSGRLVLGYVPLVLVVLVAAADLLAGRAWARIGRLGIAGLILVPLVPNAVSAARLTVNPLRFEEIRPLLQQVERDYRPGQLLYVHYEAYTAFHVYQELGIHLKSTGKMFIVHRPSCQDDVLLRNAGALGKQVWFIFSHQLGTAPNEDEQVHEHLQAEGTVIRDIRTHGADALLVQIRSSFDELTPGVPGDCLQVVQTR